MTPRFASFAALLRRLRLPAAAAVACAGTLFAGSTLVIDSPFAPAGALASGGNAPAEAYELAGASAQGSQISVCIFERQKKHSEWIPVGGDVDGVHVISYDGAHDTVVVSIAGSRRELSMRKAVVASMNPPAGRLAQAPERPAAALPGPITSAPPQATPAAATTTAQDQKEARMLVSDLLEIGVQQRKAYQDAKLKAAQGTPPSQGN
jgi:hypothetical protein